ncbi:MAG: zf-TFIIB domain-containing protein [Planctomycetaceae bacterium]|nr:zf-TFIIB domain-containing protein [Planctomycetaceae bacterium]
MLCPVCRKPMVIVEFQSIELDTCLDCHGLWFDAQELNHLFDLAGCPRHLHGRHDLAAQVDRLPHVESRRRCPRCRRPLESVRAHSPADALILDKCPHGDGLWFDQGELESLLTARLGEDADALDRMRGFLGEFASVRRGPQDGLA